MPWRDKIIVVSDRGRSLTLKAGLLVITSIGKTASSAASTNHKRHCIQVGLHGRSGLRNAFPGHAFVVGVELVVQASILVNTADIFYLSELVGIL